MAAYKKTLEPISDIDADTLHIAIATYPKNQMDDYVSSIKDYYTRARQNIESHFSKDGKSKNKEYYTPLVYHLLGGYDICFITLIDNHKFPQNLFYPKNDTYNPNSFVIQTGICYNSDKSGSLLKTYQFNKIKPFVCVINLKLNNSILIGNGKSFVENCMAGIADLLKKMVVLKMTLFFFNLSHGLKLI